MGPGQRGGVASLAVALGRTLQKTGNKHCDRLVTDMRGDMGLGRMVLVLKDQ